MYNQVQMLEYTHEHGYTEIQLLKYKYKKMKMKCTTLPPESGSGCQSAKHRWRTNFQKIENIPLRNSALISCEHTLFFSDVFTNDDDFH